MTLSKRFVPSSEEEMEICKGFVPENTKKYSKNGEWRGMQGLMTTASCVLPTYWIVPKHVSSTTGSHGL